MIAAYRWTQHQEQAEFTAISKEDVLGAILACFPAKGMLTEPDFDNIDDGQKIEFFFDEILELGRRALAANPMLKMMRMSPQT